VSVPDQNLSASDQRPIVEPSPLQSEQQRLIALFAELETKQLDTLDAAGKSLIERIATMLAIVFAVIAFGNNFPPAYLSNPLARYLVMAALIAFIFSLYASMRVVLPRNYRLFRNNLTGMRTELDRMIADKVRGVQVAYILFWCGSILLVALTGVLIFA
jgi:hypothetical protein